MLAYTKLAENISKCEFHNPPVIITVNKFDEDAAKSFTSMMNRAHSSDQPIIPIVIDSYGGHVDSLLSMIADIKSAEKPIATIVKGKAMSCGSVLMSCGHRGYRYIDPNARVMIHEVSSGEVSKVSDIEIKATEMRRLNDQIFEIMALNCGKDKNYFIEEMAKRKNADWYLSPSEALALELVDHVRVPKLTQEVKIEYRFV